MNVLKTTIALSLSSVLAAPVLANPTVNLYGKANVSAQSSDDGDGSFTEIKSNASRLGVSGDMAVGNDLKVVYKIEVQVDLDGDSDENIKERNQYVGLEGSFGQVLLGKNDTVTKVSQGKVDLFNDYEGDIKVLWKGDNRNSDSLTYRTPKFNDFQLGLTYTAEGDEESEDGISASIVYGDSKLKKNDFYASIAMDDEVNGYDVVRGTFSTKLAGVTLGAMYQTQENVETKEEMDGFMLSASYGINDFTLKGQYQAADYDDKGDLSGVSAGVDYKLAKNAKVYVWYTTFDMDSADDRDYVATGIELKF